jgi:hypothetical protein
MPTNTHWKISDSYGADISWGSEDNILEPYGRRHHHTRYHKTPTPHPTKTPTPHPTKTPTPHPTKTPTPHPTKTPTPHPMFNYKRPSAVPATSVEPSEKMNGMLDKHNQGPLGSQVPMSVSKGPFDRGQGMLGVGSQGPMGADGRGQGGVLNGSQGPFGGGGLLSSSLPPPQQQPSMIPSMVPSLVMTPPSSSSTQPPMSLIVSNSNFQTFSSNNSSISVPLPGSTFIYPNSFVSAGCWTDTATRAIPTQASGSYNSASCLQEAQSTGSSVMALQYGNQCFIGTPDNSNFAQYGSASASSTDCGTTKAAWTNAVQADFTKLVKGWTFNAILANDGSGFGFPKPAPSTQYAVLQNNGMSMNTTFTIPTAGNYNLYMQMCGRPNTGTDQVTVSINNPNSSIQNEMSPMTCEGNSVTLSCPSPSIILSGNVTYGRFVNKKCPGTGFNSSTPSKSNIYNLPSRCNYQASCTFSNSDVTSDDPDPGVFKQFLTSYQCGPTPPVMVVPPAASGSNNGITKNWQGFVTDVNIQQGNSVLQIAGQQVGTADCSTAVTNVFVWANMVTNGFFTNEFLAMNTYKYNASVTAWTFNAVLVNTSSAWGFTQPYPLMMPQCAAIQITQNMIQTINLPQGTFTLSFYYTGRPGGANNIEVAFSTPSGGKFVITTLVDTSTSTTSWIQFQGRFSTPSAGLYTLNFNGLGNKTNPAQDVTTAIAVVQIY